MAHSAGAPYAMAFANRNVERVQGALCLLAPWVGAGEGGTLPPIRFKSINVLMAVCSFWLQVVEICPHGSYQDSTGR